MFLTISTFGGICIIVYHLATNTYGDGQIVFVEKSDLPSYIFPVLVLIAKFGTSAGFNISYVANAEVFPSLFQGSAMGICNFVARSFTIFAPVIAEIVGFTPMILFTAANLITLLFVRGL
jgi:hypothetical protein